SSPATPSPATKMRVQQMLQLAAMAPLAMAVDLCDQFAYHNEAGWYFNNNEWGSGSGSGDQCTHVDSVSSSGVSWHTEWSWSGGENNVKSYPYSGRELSDKKLVNTISKIPSGADWSYSGSDIRANVAYDIFTAADPNHEISSGDHELMIWLGRLGGVYPIGQSTGTVQAAGRSWDLYVGYNGAMKVYSFIAPEQINNFDGDVKEFFNVITEQQGFPADSQHLITLQFGTEPFTGSNAQFDVHHWSGSVE
ncbi:unnamed protein product, partial [Clonostachys solani]